MPGQKRRRVAERDKHNVRGQPELRVEHGLQNGKGVTIAGEQIRDPKCSRAESARNQVSNAELEQDFEHQPSNYAAPADEDRRRIQVRHRRTTGDVDAGSQCERVDGQSYQNDQERRAVQRLRPSQQADCCDDECKDVSPRRVIERREMVVERLEASSSQ